jgi:putative transposase
MEDTVLALLRPGSSLTDDPLLAVLREGARRMLMQAIEAEVEAFLAAHAGLVDGQVRLPKLRDRAAAAGEPIAHRLEVAA